MDKMFVSQTDNAAGKARIDAAAEAIAKLVDERPVDRVQAMAALIGDYCAHDHVGYYVPENGGTHEVWDDGKGLQCDCNAPDCDHIKAVELHRAGQVAK